MKILRNFEKSCIVNVLQIKSLLYKNRYIKIKNIGINNDYLIINKIISIKYFLKYFFYVDQSILLSICKFCKSWNKNNFL